MSGEITVLLLARGDDRDKSPTIYTWKPGGPLLQKRVMESFHVSLNIGSPGCHPPPEALVLLDGDFPGRKLRALDLFEGSVIYEVDAPKGSEYSAWFFIDSSAAKTDRSRIDFGLLWGTAKVQNTSWQLLCWSPKYQ
ncbi:hypothetical protein Pmar_PMAR001243 [Perkinsus marinus ATCC 50983]|uniref:Uncharacterized protein n=1 Tax=Perkinsus marinus (strain ATCC 50983 / TXsc) TaxID=423536 RepID=C5KT95_PERM5|nr:hypothetical protein Pmar_PMAR001243 [Perkinsus marinus ATCC 50983]EER12445.1 hypothetical protein Pmar_PMAR001243 [Perkinsus marinus ATCC 50983]|eukprot:XP_002780650.1 hypothetical protein Pmar_PMAR001243 [Perkinsus marinus ATCC 50983]